MSNLERVISGIAARLLGLGEVWFYAWIFNPPIHSNVVWFIGLIVGSIQSGLTTNASRLMEIKKKLGLYNE